MKKTLFLSLTLGLGLIGVVRAQEAAPLSSEPAPRYSTTVNYGLLGTTYAGADFGYTERETAPGGVARRYGFVYNQPLPEGVDFNFNYDYLRSSAGGFDLSGHEVALGLTGFLPQSWGKPFLNGDLGWAWQKTPGGRDDSFFYKIKAGVELQLAQRFVLIPYVYYKDAPDLSSHAWHYGAKAVYRFTPQWSAGLGAEIDEDKNTEYTLGVKFHY